MNALIDRTWVGVDWARAVPRGEASAAAGGAWLAIVNPCAGPPRPAGWHLALRSRLRQELGAQVVFTRRPGHAAELAAAAGWAAGVAVVGGDGTLAEVVNALDLDRQFLLVLSGGTGNGLARDLRRRAPTEAGIVVGARAARLLDLVQVTIQSAAGTQTRLMLSTAALGYAAEVVRQAGRLPKALGHARYTAASAAQVVRQAAFEAEVSVEGQAAQRRLFTNLMVNNTQHAGNFRAFPAADLTDGRFDVLWRRASAGGQLLENLSVLAGGQALVPVPTFQGRRLVCRLTAPQLLMLDGELWPAVTAVSFEVLPRRLRCLA